MEGAPKNTDTSPKDIPIYLKNRGGKSYQVLVRLKNVPGALAEAASVLGRVPLNILGGIISVSGDNGTWTFFAESSEDGPSPEELREMLVRSRKVLNATVKGNADGFLVDTLCFPVRWNTGDRVILMRMTYLTTMLDEIRREFGSGGEVILFRQGLAFGRSTWANLMQQIGEDYAKSHVPDILKIYDATGWGKVDVVSYNPGALTATIRTEDGFECTGHSSEGPWSHFMRGSILGAMIVFMGAEDLDCEETKCIAKGDEFCEYQIARKEPRD